MIETDRLILKRPELGDEIELNHAINHSLASLQRWMPWAMDPSLETTQKFIIDGVAQWKSPHQSEFPLIAYHKDSKKLIGATGYNEKSQPEVPWYEIGYWLDIDFLGQGLATELTCALKDYAINDLKAIRVQICTEVDNLASRKVAEKSGFTLEACLKNYRLSHMTGKSIDEVIYACFQA